MCNIASFLAIGVAVLSTGCYNKKNPLLSKDLTRYKRAFSSVVISL
jgi:hypothetical protein